MAVEVDGDRAVRETVEQGGDGGVTEDAGSVAIWSRVWPPSAAAA
jgi:hypothetical protein